MPRLPWSDADLDTLGAGSFLERTTQAIKQVMAPYAPPPSSFADEPQPAAPQPAAPAAPMSFDLRDWTPWREKSSAPASAVPSSLDDAGWFPWRPKPPTTPTTPSASGGGATPQQAGGRGFWRGDGDQHPDQGIYRGGSDTSDPGIYRGGGVRQGEIETYIRQAAAARGINPDTAIRVAQAEGGLDDPIRQSDVVYQGQREQSYGPFQLNVSGGVGSAALKAGIDPRNPAQWRQAVDFGLDEVARSGWGQWHGAARVGVGEREGIGGPRTPMQTTPLQAEQTPAAQRQAFAAGDLTPNQINAATAEGLDYETALAVCGPAAAIAFARKTGRNPTMQEAVGLARQVGWTAAQGMAGPASQKRLLDSLGVASRLVEGAPDWQAVAADVQRGNPVILSTPGHYFVAERFDSASGAFDFGNSAAVLKASGGKRWFRPDELSSLGMGAAHASLFMDSPESPSPSAVAGRTAPNAGAAPSSAPAAPPVAPAAESPPAPAAGAEGPPVMWSPDSPTGAPTVAQASAGRQGGGIYSRPNMPTDPEASTGQEYDSRDADQGPRESGYTIPQILSDEKRNPDPSVYGGAGDEQGAVPYTGGGGGAGASAQGRTPSGEQAEAAGSMPLPAERPLPAAATPPADVLPTPADVLPTPADVLPTPADDPGGAQFAAQDAYSTPAPTPQPYSPYGEPREPTQRLQPNVAPTAPTSTQVPVWDESGENVVGYRQAPPPAQRQVQQRLADGTGAVTSTPGEPDYVPQPPNRLEQFGQYVGTAGGIAETSSRMREINDRAAREQGKAPTDVRAMFEAAQDPAWRAANPALAAEYDALQYEYTLNVAGQVGDSKVATQAGQTARTLLDEAVAGGVRAAAGGAAGNALTPEDATPWERAGNIAAGAGAGALASGRSVRAAGRAGRALAEEGARQLMDVTPMPRIVQPGEGGMIPRDAWNRNVADELGVTPRETLIAEGYIDSLGRQVKQPPYGRPLAASWRAMQGDAGLEMAQYRPNFFGNAEEIAGTRKPLDAVYRVISREDYEGSLQRGYLQSDGRLNLDAGEGTVASAFEPSPFYSPKSADAVAVRIRVDPQDGWHLNDTDGYVKTNKPIPVDRIEGKLAYATDEFGNATRYEPASAPRPDAPQPRMIQEGVGGAAERLIVRPQGWEAASDDVAGLTRPGHFYRGMTEAEFNATLGGGGGVQSNRAYSVAGEGTSFSHQAQDAESYVNYGRDDPRKTGRPTYLIEVAGEDGLKMDRDGYWKAQDAIPLERITRIIQMGAEDGAVVGRDLPVPSQAAAQAPDAPGVQYLGSGVVPDGNRRMYHGTASEFGRPDPGKFDQNGLFGPGYYLTSDSRVASSYAVDKSGPASGVFGVSVNGMRFTNPQYLRETIDIRRARVSALEDELSRAPAPTSWSEESRMFESRRNLERAQQDLAQLEAGLSKMEGGVAAGPNIRPIDVPAGVNLLDMDGELDPVHVGRAMLSRLGKRQRAAVGKALEDAEHTESEALRAIDVYDALASVLGKDGANRILRRSGYDGITHSGGSVMPIHDADGNPISHNVNVIFPESLDKIRNAFSGEAGGSGVVPSLSPGLRATAYNAAQGAAIGMGSESLEAGAEGRDVDLGEAVRRGVTGAGLAAFAGSRAARGVARGAQRLGSGVVPSGGPEPRRRLTPPAERLAAAGGRAITSTPAEEVSRLRLDKFPEEVRDLIEAGAKEQDYARTQRRGVLPDEAVQRLAEDDVKSVDDLIKKGKAGRAYNPEETVALRNAVASQADTVRGLSDEIAEARANNVTPDLLIARRAAEATRLNGLIQIAEGARAEAGRTLRAYRQQARLIDLDPNQAVQQIYKRLGGKDNAEAAIDEYTKLVQDGANPIQLAKFWARVESGKITKSDLFALYRRFNMLSGPRTFEVNALSGAVNLAHEVIGSALGQGARGRFAEGATEAAAPLKAAGRAFKNMAETMWHGVSGEQALRGDIPRTLSSRTDNIAAKGALTAMEVPDRLNAGVDQFFRTMTEDWAATRLAHQQARADGIGPRSRNWAETVAKHLEAIRDDPSKFPQIKAMADRVTFSEEPGGIVKWLEEGKRKSPNIVGFIAPFIRTPANIASRAVDLSPLGPVRTAVEAGTGIGRGRANLPVRIRDNAIGVAATVWAYDQAQQGNITGAGPDDPEKLAALRGTGWQPYSVKIGDQYWSYANFAPFSLALSTGAAVHEAQKYAKPGKTDALSMLSDGAARTGKVVTDMTVLAGLGAVVKSIQDPDRYGTQWLTQALQQLMPAGSLVNTVGQATDPLIRRSERTDVGTQVSQNLQARVPGLRQNVSVAQDPLGRPIPNEQTGFGALNPFRPTTERPNATLQAFIDAGVDIGKPRDTLTLRAGAPPISITPAEQRRWNEIRGEQLEKVAPQVARATSYQGAGKSGQETVLKRLLSTAANAADAQLASEIGNAEIRRRLTEAVQKKAS